MKIENIISHCKAKTGFNRVVSAKVITEKTRGNPNPPRDLLRVSVAYVQIKGEYANASTVKDREKPIELPKHIKESFYEEGVKFWRGWNGKIYLPRLVSLNHQSELYFFSKDGKEVTDTSQIYAEHLPKPKKTKEEYAEKEQAAFAGWDIENIVSLDNKDKFSIEDLKELFTAPARVTTPA